MKKNSLFTCVLLLIYFPCFGINAITFHQNFYNKTLSFDSLELEINELDTCLVLTNANCNALQTFSSTIKNGTLDSIDINWEIILDGEVLATGKGSQFNYEVELNQPYEITFSAYQCTKSETFTFTDCQTPNIELQSGTRVEYVPPGGLVFYPKMVIENATDNCSNSTDLQFRVWHEFLGNSLPNNIEEVQSLPTNLLSFYFDIFDFPDTQQVIIYAIDAAGNYAFDSTDIIIYCWEPCTDVPPNTIFIEGKIVNTSEEKMEAVEITIAGGVEDTIYSDTAGKFYFYREYYGSFDLMPAKTDEVINGVTTFDLLLIQKHILGIQPFESPYQFLSADVDFSGTVTTFDLLTIKKVLLAKEEAFPTGQSWLFVPKDYEFQTANPANEYYPTGLKIEAIDRDESLTVEFIGIKLGDVNGSATPNMRK